MFETVISAFSAFNQVGFLIAGGFCLLLGLLLLGDSLHWRLRAERVTGRIAGVRRKGEFFYPVYHYNLAAGAAVETTSDTGTNGITGKETGREIPLLVFRDRPGDARSARSIVAETVGFLLAAPGAFFVYLAFTAYPVSGMTWGMCAAFLAYGAWRFSRHIIPREQRGTKEEWREKRRARKKAEREALPVVRMEDYLASEEGQKRLAEIRKGRRISAPVFLVLAIVLLGGGAHEWRKASLLAREGLQAQGRVVTLEDRRNSDGKTMYHPVVAFKTRAGKSVRFTGKSGARPPLYRAGEEVKVLYLEKNPQGSAVLDKGFWNFLLPGLLAAAGFLCLWRSVSAFLQLARREKARTGPVAG